MKLFFFCPRWGQEHLSWDVFLEKVKTAGYNGVETSLPMDKFERSEIVTKINEYGLFLIAQHWETIESDFTLHEKEYLIRLEALASVRPLLINTQTGKDYYTTKQNIKLIRGAQLISKKTGIPIFHETHRGKFSFAAHVTYGYLRKLKQFQLTLDASHWCNVSETLLEDQADAMEMALQRTDHIHARVGHAQGPQVNDPRAPEWADALNAHLAWWDKVIAMKKQQGKNLTILTEFGPPDYLPTKPYTKAPLANQWEINVYMMHLLRKRYAYNN